MAFTTWTALKQQILDDLQGQALTVGEYRTPGGQLVRYRTLDELQKLLGWVSEMAANEAAAGSGSGSRRVHAVSQGPR